jgi:very-short-patch-repair endonuclease/predicted transcriptional regulator of viral defense system
MSGLTDHTPLDRAIAALAARQHGVVALYQLVRLGLMKNAVAERVKAGRLHPVHRGVYAVGHELLTIKGRYMAAVLACGEGSVLSYRAAADLLGLVRGGAWRAIDVTSPTRAGRKRAGIAVHAARTLAPVDVTAVDRIPCTAVPRTLLDLAEATTKRELQRAIERAVTLQLFDLMAIDELLSRSNGRRGTPRLRQAIAAYDDAPTRSELERAFLEICLRASLPRPEVNARVDLYEVDFLWRAQKLIVETDGLETHGTRSAIERDHRRDRRLRSLSWRVERFTWREVMHEPGGVARELRTLLSAAA